jgi:uncharacterized small protein (DUF1192 family)
MGGRAVSKKHGRIAEAKKESAKLKTNHGSTDSMTQVMEGRDDDYEVMGASYVQEYEERLGSLKEEVKRLKKIKKQQKKINKLEEERVDVLKEIEKRKYKEKKLKGNKKR